MSRRDTEETRHRDHPVPSPVPHRRRRRGRSRSRRPLDRRHRRPPRPAGRRPRAGGRLWRRDGVVRRLDVGPGQPARTGRRCARGRRGVPHLPARGSRSGLRLRARRRLPRGRAGDGAVLPRTDRPDVRARRDDLRRLRRPARRRHRAPLRGSRARRRSHARRRRAGEAPSSAVRDLVPRHGGHGRAGPRCLPLRLARKSPWPAARHPPRRPARLRPGHPAPRPAAGQRDRARRPAPALGAGPRRGHARLVAGHRAAPRVRRPGHRRRRRHSRRARANHRGPGRRARGRRLPHDVARRRTLFPRTPTGTEHWSLAPTTADGAGTTLGESAGGRLRTDLHSPAAWCPVSLVPLPVGADRHVPAHHGPRQARQHRRARRQVAGSSTRRTATTTTSPR